MILSCIKGAIAVEKASGGAGIFAQEQSDATAGLGIVGQFLPYRGRQGRRVEDEDPGISGELGLLQILQIEDFALEASQTLLPEFVGRQRFAEIRAGDRGRLRRRTKLRQGSWTSTVK